MKLDRKLDLAKQHIAFLTRHDDASTAIREAALDNILGFVEAEREAMKTRAAERESGEIKALVGCGDDEAAPSVQV